MPELAKVAREQEGRAAVLLLKWVGKDAVARKLLVDAGVPLWAASSGEEVSELFAMNATPTAFLVRSDGMIVRKIVGRQSAAFWSAQLDEVGKWKGQEKR